MSKRIAGCGDERIKRSRATEGFSFFIFLSFIRRNNTKTPEEEKIKYFVFFRGSYGYFSNVFTP